MEQAPSPAKAQPGAAVPHFLSLYLHFALKGSFSEFSIGLGYPQLFNGKIKNP
jgi:hypothetical protein